MNKRMQFSKRITNKCGNKRMTALNRRKIKSNGNYCINFSKTSFHLQYLHKLNLLNDHENLKRLNESLILV